jgi:hypothetical protein
MTTRALAEQVEGEPTTARATCATCSFYRKTAQRIGLCHAQGRPETSFDQNYCVWHSPLTPRSNYDRMDVVQECTQERIGTRSEP